MEDLTATVDARENTATTGRGVPIYWMNGAKVADNYADFYDGSWDQRKCGNQELGQETCYGLVWTGTMNDGRKDPTLFMGSPVGHMRYAGILSAGTGIS